MRSVPMRSATRYSGATYRVYPRACGGTLIVSAVGVGGPGLSPRLRRNPDDGGDGGLVNYRETLFVIITKDRCAKCGRNRAFDEKSNTRLTFRAGFHGSWRDSAGHFPRRAVFSRCNR